MITSCENKDEKKMMDTTNSYKEIISNPIENDSLEITITDLPSKKTASLLYEDSDLNIAYINIENQSNITKTIAKKILKPSRSNYSLHYRTFAVIDKKTQRFYYDFFIGHKVTTVNFKFNGDNGDIKLQNSSSDIIQYDNIYNEYRNITDKTNKISITDKINKITALHSQFKNKYKDKNRSSINDLTFYTQLSLLKPNDKRIEDFLINTEKPLWSIDLSILMYEFLKEKKDNLYLIDLNKTKNNALNHLVEVAVSWHLQQFKDEKYPNYNNNLKWFKSTKYYQNKKDVLDKMLLAKPNISSLNNQLFSFDLKDKTTVKKLEKIVSNHKSKYYLLDFWATWCAPCLQNISTMHKMRLPANLEVIYISMDKTKDKEKWSRKSKELELANSYLFVENENNKNVINDIELNKLPRYILIDNNYNILNIDLISPQDSEFLKVLNSFVK